MDWVLFIFEKKIVILIAFTVISILAAIIITLYQQKPKDKKEEKTESYSETIKKLTKNKTPEQQLEILNKLFKEFMHTKFNLSPKFELEDIREHFKDKAKEKDIFNLCSIMIEAYYSGEKISESLVEKVKEDFIAIERAREEKVKKSGFHLFSHSPAPKKKENKKFTKYITSMPGPPKKGGIDNKLNKISKIEAKEEKPIIHGRDHHNNLSVFSSKHHAQRAKENIAFAKKHLKNINNSIKNSKNGAMNENLSISDWANNLGELKSGMISDYKKIISKL